MMLSRIAPLTRFLAFKSMMPRFTGSKAHDSRFCQPHMNELPIACHTWGQHYERRQSAYNKVLLAGVLWFLFSLFMMIATNSFRLFAFPPKVPSPPTEIVDDCNDDY